MKISHSSSDAATPSPTPWLKLLLAWLVVAVPAVWGVSQTVNKSLPLFTSTTPPAAAPATAPDLVPGPISR